MLLFSRSAGPWHSYQMLWTAYRQVPPHVASKSRADNRPAGGAESEGVERRAGLASKPEIAVALSLDFVWYDPLRHGRSQPRSSSARISQMLSKQMWSTVSVSQRSGGSSTRLQILWQEGKDGQDLARKL